MNIVGLFARPLYWLAGKIFSLWARPAIQPEVPAEYITDPDAAVCYVLETGGLADRLALERACRLHGMPSPNEPFQFGDHRESRRVITLRKRRGFFARRPGLQGSKRLARLVEAAEQANGRELLLIPVAIYWGRSPDKERSVFKLFFSENWEVAGRTRKFFQTLLHGRSTLLHYSHALPLRSIVDGNEDASVAVRKVWRVLRVHFRKRRAATLGPDLSHRRTLIDQLLRMPNVQRAIAAEGADAESRAKAEKKAREYALEIAADISYSTVRVVERLLKWLWHRIYDGIELNHMQRVHEAAKEQEIVYVPCHRSHFDYLLLSYIVYEEGLQLPHVAAGINLNMPIIGRILRRGGAFFLRRSFKGNRLYATVFDAYLQLILSRGHSIEYFVEGGRSRTGRLLQPKGGMLVMTVHSWVREPKRPLAFMPVYFGYEKLIEGDSFISELGGAQKQKESLFGLIKSIRALRENFGKVYVNVGEPIELGPLLDELRPNWRDDVGEDCERPDWLAEVIDDLGGRIMNHINSAAAVTPISLLAYVLLATPKQTIGVDELRRQLALTVELLRRFHYSDSVTLPDMTPDDMIAHGEKLGVISRSPHPMGDVIHMPEHTAVRMTYFRNNILHLLAVAASVACCFIQGRRLEHTELQRLVRLIYPFMQKELCTKWSVDEIDAATTNAIEALIDLELLSRARNKSILVRPPAGSAKAYQLLMLGQTMVPMLQRFYLAIAILVHNGSGTLSRARLETLCQQSAERLSMIYGLHSPDFFNKTLFHDFIRKLQDLKVVRRNSDGKLEFDEDIVTIGTDARLVLGEEIRHSILSLTFLDSSDNA